MEEKAKWDNHTVNHSRLLRYGMIALCSGVLLYLLWQVSLGYVQMYLPKTLLCFFSLAAFLFFGVLWFERQVYGAATLVLLSLSIAIGAMGRVVFAAIPSVQPTSFVVILCGLAFGGKFGFMVGVGAAFWSNLFLGHGPWSLWQMAAWGLMGVVSGIGRRLFLGQPMLLILWGFVSGVLFGVGMNIWYVVTFLPEFSWGAVAVSCATSIYFDIAHGVTNAFLLWWQGDRWLGLLTRAKKQYDLQ